MLSIPNLSNNHKLLIGFAPFGLYVLVFLISPDIIYYADALQHFFISSGIPVKNELFLDHWGKPLFSMLVFPFSFLGLKGLVVFNLLLTGLIILLLHKIALKLQLPWWTTICGTTLMLFMPEYFLVAFAGLTEILFATLVILTIWLVISERFNWAALVAGFTLFSRPEAEIFLPFLVLYLLTQKKFKALLWLPTAFVLYGIIGLFILEDFWWYFNNQPYNPAGSAYGSGELFHFIQNFPEAIGVSLSILLIAGLLICLFDLRNPFHQRTLFWWLLVIAPALSVLIVHSYLWWKGIYGSAGLMRVLVTTAPLYVLIAIRTLPVLKSKIGTKSFLISAVPALLFQFFQSSEKHGIPIKMDAKTAMLKKAGTELHPLLSKRDTIYTIEPFTLYWAGINSMTESRVIWQSHLMSGNKIKPLGGKTGIIWDSQFSPVEGNLPLNLLLSENKVQIKKAWTQEPDLSNFSYLSEIIYFESGINPGTIIHHYHSEPILHRKASNNDVVIIPDDEYFFTLFDTALNTFNIDGAVIQIKFALVKEEAKAPKDFKVVIRLYNKENTSFYRKWPENQFLPFENSIESMDFSLLLPKFKILPPNSNLKVELWLRDNEPFEMRNFEMMLFEAPD